VLSYRLKLGDGLLLCIDGCSNLKPAQWKYFIEFLQRFDKPIGLVFRMSDYYANQLASKKKFEDSYQRLENVVDNGRVLTRCSDDEVRDIATTKIADPMLIADLEAVSRGNLSVLNNTLTE
jgi:hypothetical protein